LKGQASVDSAIPPGIVTGMDKDVVK